MQLVAVDPQETCLSLRSAVKLLEVSVSERTDQLKTYKIASGASAHPLILSSDVLVVYITSRRVSPGSERKCVHVVDGDSRYCPAMKAAPLLTRSFVQTTTG